MELIDLFLSPWSQAELGHFFWNVSGCCILTELRLPLQNSRVRLAKTSQLSICWDWCTAIVSTLVLVSYFRCSQNWCWIIQKPAVLLSVLMSGWGRIHKFCFLRGVRPYQILFGCLFLTVCISHQALMKEEEAKSPNVKVAVRKLTNKLKSP